VSLIMLIPYSLSLSLYSRHLHAFKLNPVFAYPSLLFLVDLVMGCVSRLVMLSIALGIWFVCDLKLINRTVTHEGSRWITFCSNMVVKFGCPIWKLCLEVYQQFEAMSRGYQ
jgi:hypothetical protein